MRRLLVSMLAIGALAFAIGSVPPAYAQESVPAAEAEGGQLWFVELVGPPTADGNSLAAVRNEKAAFRRNAAAAGVSFVERRSFDVLFNGFSVAIAPGQRAKLASVPGVKAIYPVELVHAPTPEQSIGALPDLATAIGMTGADIAQNSLGFSGAGVKVAVMDTGIDIDHPDFGGTGADGTTSFPSARVAYGYDFVGDAFDANPNNPTYNPVPVPDPNPDDCGGHGTHVAGIVGANGAAKGVAPAVTFGAYRVFGCNGSTTSDIMIAAMEAALADGMDVLNMSIGAAFQWPQYPTAMAASRLVNKGMVVVASIGNSGANGLYSASAPGVGDKVIGVASYDNLAASQIAFSVTPGGNLVGFNLAAAAPPPPTSGSLQMARTGTTATTNDACNAVVPAPGSLSGMAVLIRRGTCGFYEKAVNAQNAGAAAVVLYNNSAGAFNPTVAGTPPVTIPVVAVTASDGALLDAKIQAGVTTLHWGTQTVSTTLSTGGLISGFSSYGLAPDLTLKPDLGAPGGSIFSTYPVELGSYASISGTSMASPHVAGAVALLLQAKPNTSAQDVRGILQNSADPKLWWGNPALGFLDNVHRQGAGMVDIDDAILSTARIEPAKLSLGESEVGPVTRTLTIKNDSASDVTYALGHAPSLSTGPNTFTPAFLTGFASVSFSSSSVTVAAHGTATVDVTISANPTLADLSQYGGYLVFTPQGGGQPLHVPYAGLKGDYQTKQVLVPTANQFPWLAKLAGGFFTNQPSGATFTMVDDDVPFFLVHLDHQARRIEFQVFNAGNGKPVHPVFYTTDVFEYVGRNSTSTGFFSFAWDGTRMHDNGKGTPDHRKVVPNGQYRIVLKVLKALGDEDNPAHWETWTSPVITIARN